MISYETGSQSLSYENRSEARCYDAAGLTPTVTLTVQYHAVRHTVSGNAYEP